MPSCFLPIYHSQIFAVIFKHFFYDSYMTYKEGLVTGIGLVLVDEKIVLVNYGYSRLIQQLNMC